MIKVANEQGLVRDPYSKAIIRTDVDTLRDQRRRRSLLKQTVQNTDRVDRLEQEMKEIKDLLLQLINK